MRARPLRNCDFSLQGQASRRFKQSFASCPQLTFTRGSRLDERCLRLFGILLSARPCRWGTASNSRACYVFRLFNSFSAFRLNSAGKDPSSRPMQLRTRLCGVELLPYSICHLQVCSVQKCGNKKDIFGLRSSELIKAAGFAALVLSCMRVFFLACACCEHLVRQFGQDEKAGVRWK